MFFARSSCRSVGSGAQRLLVSADTTDVLSADTSPPVDLAHPPPLWSWHIPHLFGFGRFSIPRIWQIWHPKNGIWSPFGYIGRSPSQNRRSGTVALRRTQPWWCQALGTPLFLGKQGYDGALGPFWALGAWLGLLLDPWTLLGPLGPRAQFISP